MYKILIALFVISFGNGFAFDFGIGDLPEKEAIIDKIDTTCGGRKDLVIIYNIRKLQFLQDKIVLNGTFIVKENIAYPLSLALNIRRCKSKDDLKSCENFHSFKTDKYCQLIKSDSEIWNPFFASIKPKWKCPLKKGTYIADASPLDVSAFLLFPVDGWFWKVKGEILNRRTNKAIMCTMIEARVEVKTKNT